MVGAYGTFGRLICHELVKDPVVELVVAGRSLEKAEAFCELLLDYDPVNLPFAVAIDLNERRLIESLSEVHPDLLINTCGPFQLRDYRVAEACIEFGVNYIDLADGRDFVNNFSSLDASAKKHQVLCVSGASTVPGVSSAVVDKYAVDFSKIDSINIAISPGNKSERGLATVAAILSYTGKPFDVWSKGKWQKKFGWMNSQKIQFGPLVGERWVANVDVPDLAIFPARYKAINQVSFQAGLELPLLHHAMTFMAKLAKMGVINNWHPWSRQCLALSNLFRFWGSDNGGMIVDIIGKKVADKRLGNNQQKSETVRWILDAGQNSGPKVPAASAIILTGKLARGEIELCGALPCVGLFSLEEFESLVRSWGIHTYAE